MSAERFLPRPEFSGLIPATTPPETEPWKSAAPLLLSLCNSVSNPDDHDAQYRLYQTMRVLKGQVA